MLHPDQYDSLDFYRKLIISPCNVPESQETSSSQTLIVVLVDHDSDLRTYYRVRSRNLKL